jgi:ketosteroid isomerase-like protein
MHANAEQEILTQEENLTQATRQLDIEALDRIYADDMMFTGVTGSVCNKSAVMEEARRGVAERQAAAVGGKPVVTSYDKEDIKVVVHGDTAVTSYRFVVRIEAEAKDINRRYRTTNVWVKRQGDWQVVAAHTANLDP